MIVAELSVVVVFRGVGHLHLFTGNSKRPGQIAPLGIPGRLPYNCSLHRLRMTVIVTSATHTSDD